MRRPRRVCPRRSRTPSRPATPSCCDGRCGRTVRPRRWVAIRACRARATGSRIARATTRWTRRRDRRGPAARRLSRLPASWSPRTPLCVCVAAWSPPTTVRAQLCRHPRHRSRRVRCSARRRGCAWRGPGGWSGASDPRSGWFRRALSWRHLDDVTCRGVGTATRGGRRRTVAASRGRVAPSLHPPTLGWACSFANPPRYDEINRRRPPRAMGLRGFLGGRSCRREFRSLSNGSNGQIRV